MKTNIWLKGCESGHCVEVQFISGCDTNACVEVGHDGGDVLIRDSKDPEGPVLRFTDEEWTNFQGAVRAGAFD